MKDHLGLSKKERKHLIEKMRGLVKPKVIQEEIVKETPQVLCPRCNKFVERLTKDHIIPKWFARRFPLLVGGKMNKERKKQMMCQPCNLKKGGRIDFTDEYSREYVSKIIKILQDNLDKNS